MGISDCQESAQVIENHILKRDTITAEAEFRINRLGKINTDKNPEHQNRVRLALQISIKKPEE